MPIKPEGVKRIFWIILNTVLGVGVILILVSVKAVWQYGQSVYPARAISVSAEGKVVVSPDIATLDFSVVSEGANPEKLQNDNNKKVNDAITFLKNEGIDAKDIKTGGYNLSPRYQYDDKRRTSYISGYTLTQTVVVKIRDFSKAGKILVTLPGLGINQISSLSFDVEDPNKFLNEARKEAFTKAFAKAESMAGQNHVKIKRVVTFNENSGGYPIPFYAKAEVGRGGGMGPVLVPPSIEPGSQEVTVQVSVVYEIW